MTDGVRDPFYLDPMMRLRLMQSLLQADELAVPPALDPLLDPTACPPGASARLPTRDSALTAYLARSGWVLR